MAAESEVLDEEIAVYLPSISVRNQISFGFLFTSVTVTALLCVSLMVSGKVESDSACAPPESYETSNRASAFAAIQLALVALLTAGLLYGPVHWNLLSIGFCAAQTTLSIVYCGSQKTEDAALYVTALAPGFSCMLHYAALSSIQKRNLFVLAVCSLAFACAQVGLAVSQISERGLVLAAGLCEIIGVLFIYIMYRRKII